MWCTKCNRHLSECICPDLEERLEKLRKCPYLHVPSMVEKPLLERNLKKKQPKPKQN